MQHIKPAGIKFLQPGDDELAGGVAFRRSVETKINCGLTPGSAGSFANSQRRAQATNRELQSATLLTIRTRCVWVKATLVNLNYKSLLSCIIKSIAQLFVHLPDHALWKSKKMNDFHRRLEEEIPRLRRYARALTRNVARADDLVQETLTRAVHKQHLWQPGTDLRAWLFTIMHNQNVNQVRHAIRETTSVDLETCSQNLVATTDPTASRQLRELEYALGKLPQEQREVILLVGLEGMSYEQAAAAIRVPVGTIRSRLSRGRDALRQLMNMEERHPHRTSEHHLDPTPVAA